MFSSYIELTQLLALLRRDHESLLRAGELQADYGCDRTASSGPRRRLAACVQIIASTGVHVKARTSEGTTPSLLDMHIVPLINDFLTYLKGTLNHKIQSWKSHHNSYLSLAHHQQHANACRW